MVGAVGSRYAWTRRLWVASASAQARIASSAAYSASSVAAKPESTDELALVECRNEESAL